MRHPAQSSRAARPWPGSTTTSAIAGPKPPQGFAYYRDWVFEATGDIYQAYATAPSYPVGTERTFYLSGCQRAGGTDGALVTSPAAGRRRHQRLQQARPGRPELHRDVGARPEPAGHRSAGDGDPLRHAAADPRRWTSSARPG